jgi:hypothetical protein
MTAKGITMVEWTASGYSSPQAADAVDRMFLTGANALTVVVTFYQDGPRSDEPRVDSERTPTPSSVADIILKAKSLQFQTSVKLHVDLDNGQWRGLIAPPDPSRWFDAYGDLVVTWASLAEAMGVDQLVVGTELAGTVEHEGRWREVVARARGAFSGEMVYAASWDEARTVPFWSAVDLVGVNFYAPVASRANSHRFEILREWQPWLERLQLLHKLAARDIMVTEIGYRSIDGAGMQPHDALREAPVDLAEQADLYWAALEALGEQRWIRGVSWWNWPATGAADPSGYTPEGKPAAAVLVDAWL